MTADWLKNPHRTETFVLNFKDAESFRAFWDKYIKDNNGLNKGVSYSVVATGNRMKLLDECQDCLYEAMEALPDRYCELIEKMGKLAES